MWFSLTNKPENETETESKLEKQLDKWHMSLDNVHFTNDCESACGIWNIIRKLAESDEKKKVSTKAVVLNQKIMKVIMKP